MNMITHFKDLIVWQKSMDLVLEIYRLTRLLPQEERYALSDQLRRAAVSIPSNIAEGQARIHTKEFANFLSIAKGSSAELETQLLICSRLNYLSDEQIEISVNLINEVGKMLNAMLRKINGGNVEC